MFPTNSERLIGISDAFSAFVYGYPSSCPRAHCTPNKSVPTLRYTRRHGPVYTGHACRHLPRAVPWISEDRLFPPCHPSTLVTAPPGATDRSDPLMSNPQQTPIHHPASCLSNDRPLNNLPPEVSTTATRTQRPESPTVTLTCRANKCKVHKLHRRYILRNSNEGK